MCWRASCQISVCWHWSCLCDTLLLVWVRAVATCLPTPLPVCRSPKTMVVIYNSQGLDFTNTTFRGYAAVQKPVPLIPPRHTFHSCTMRCSSSTTRVMHSTMAGSL